MNTATLTPEMIKAVAITGQNVTVHTGGGTVEGTVITVEGHNWTTVAYPEGVELDTDGTPLEDRVTPKVAYHPEDHGNGSWSWADLSSVELTR